MPPHILYLPVRSFAHQAILRSRQHQPCDFTKTSPPHMRALASPRNPNAPELISAVSYARNYNLALPSVSLRAPNANSRTMINTADASVIPRHCKFTRDSGQMSRCECDGKDFQVIHIDSLNSYTVDLCRTRHRAKAVNCGGRPASAERRRAGSKATQEWTSGLRRMHHLRKRSDAESFTPPGPDNPTTCRDAAFTVGCCNR